MPVLASDSPPSPPSTWAATQLCPSCSVPAGYTQLSPTVEQGFPQSEEPGLVGSADRLSSRRRTRRLPAGVMTRCTRNADPRRARDTENQRIRLALLPRLRLAFSTVLRARFASRPV